MFLGTPVLSKTFPIPELTKHAKTQDTSSRGPFHVPHSICSSDLLTGSWVPWGRKWEEVFRAERTTGNSLVVQWLGLRGSIAGGTGSIPGRGTKIRQAARRGQENQKPKTKQKELLT